MSCRIFINNCQQGGHFGIIVENEILYEDSDILEFRSSRIELSIIIELNNGIQPSLKEVDNAIDDFFKNFNEPLSDDKIYKKSVSNGLVEILPHGSFGKNAIEIKAEIKEIVEFINKWDKKFNKKFTIVK